MRGYSPGESRTILVVDDEDGIRVLARDVLRGRGHRVLEAADGLEALDVAASHGGPIHLLLADWYLPGLDGVELCGRLMEQRPEIRTLMMSALARYQRPPATPFLRKPFTYSELIRKVDETLG